MAQPDSLPSPLEPSRVPQQARSLATRRKLLDAVVASLIELGHSRTTTSEVCRRAGVSQGALFKHFSTKAELIARAVEHLFAKLIADYRRAISAAAARAGDRDRVRTALRLLWGSFSQPGLHAAFELYGAARTDADLAAALAPVLEQHRDNLHAAARELFPEASVHNPRFEEVVEGVIATLQGAALGALPGPDRRSEARLLAFVEHICRAELEA